jgi:hypothetical protein
VALVDWEAVILDLEEFIETKDGRSFGQRELTDLLRGLRVRHRIQEGLPERALRLYGPDLIDALRREPATPDSEVSGGMDEGATHRIAGRAPHEGDTPSERHHPERPVVAA